MSVLTRLQAAADDVLDAEFTLASLRRSRDELVIEARAGGASLRSIGDACLVSHQTIANILEARAAVAASSTTNDKGATASSL